MSSNEDVSKSHLPELNRRQFLAAGGLSVAGLSLTRSGLAGRKLLRPATVKSVTGATLPANAAPLSQQFLVSYNNPTGATYKCLDFYESVYSRAPLADNFSTSLVRINSNFQIVPGVAQSWKQTSKTTWEFYIKPGIMWTDGNEVTANDFVETFRYSADPKHAWDFTWYWTAIGLKNYAAAVAGKAPLSSIGVGVGKNKYTFVVTTEAPVAFIPYAMLYSMPLSAAGLAKYGNALYNVNPATSISMGPYVLKSFNPTSAVVLGPNTKYTAGLRLAHPVADRQDHQCGLPATPGDRRRRHWPQSEQDQPPDRQGELETQQAHAALEPTRLPRPLRVLQDEGQAVQQPEGAPGLCPRRRPGLHHQCPDCAAGPSRVRLSHAWLPLRGQRSAEEVHQLQPRTGPATPGPGRLPEREGLPRGDVQLSSPGRLARPGHVGPGRAGPGGEL